MKKKLAFLAAVVALFAVATPVLAEKPADKGFDEFGYNRTARNFVGPASGWCLARGAAADCLGIYSNDHLKMKWNAEWDRGNAEGWTDPEGYDAWEDNQWNGAVPGGSGEVYHFKTKWVGTPCDSTNERWVEGGYCIWGQFEVLSEHWTDEFGHMWGTHAMPTGYGAN